jgi:alpha-N-arabinofuranosidase
MRLLLVAFCALMAVFAKGSDSADVEIYTDYMIGKWDDLSTCVRTLRSTEQAHSYNTSIKISLTGTTLFRVKHTWGGLVTAGYDALEFWVRGAGTGNQKLFIRAMNSWVTSPNIDLSAFVKVHPTQWRKATIPLSALGAGTNTKLQEIVISPLSISSTPDFFIDDIKLTNTSNMAPYVSVTPTRVLRTLQATMFGVATFNWDWAVTYPSTHLRLGEAGITTMTFPGGKVADEYDWATNSSTITGLQSGPGFGAFLDAANAVGAQKIVSVNYGSGTPEMALAMLQYANITRNSDVLYWNVGNECYGDFEYDTHPIPHDAVTYADFVAQCYSLMKGADSRIKIGIEGAYDEASYPQRVSVINPRTGQQVNGWAPVLLARLKELGIKPDYYTFHFYPTAPGAESDSYLFQAGAVFDQVYGQCRQMLIDFYGNAGASIPIYVTENNACWKPPGKQTTSIVNALYLVRAWGKAILGGAEAFVWWNLHNGASTDGNLSPSLYGWRNYGDFGILASGGLGNEPLNSPYPVFYALKLLKLFARPGDTLVQTSVTSDLLSVYASKSAVTGRVKLMVVNIARSSSLTSTIAVNFFTPLPIANIYRYSTAEDAAQSDASFFQAPISGQTFSITFPPLSITVIEL